jgi:peptide/nickel transport system permease protein
LSNPEKKSFTGMSWRAFCSDFTSVIGLAGILLILILAIYAPLIANRRPLLVWGGTEGFSMPFLYYLFAPDGSEKLIAKLFNFAMFFLPLAAIIAFFLWHKRKARNIALLILAVLLAVPFLTIRPKLDRTDWKQMRDDGEVKAVFTPVPYGPFEQATSPYKKPCPQHWMGGDQIGRDVLSRMLYGARVSLAVGLLATSLVLVIGTSVGLSAGYFGGRFDLVSMRIVEIIICFPTFLLLLILMSIFKDMKFQQSILIVIGVIGLTGWTGLSRLVRGETLSTRSLPYILSCESAGMSVPRILFVHLLPNISGPILVSFTFGVAGAILAESGLSFLGFGVQSPTASWGGLLRQAFADPFAYWHLTLWPGLALFITVCSFNFTGEGLRCVLDPRSR